VESLDLKSKYAGNPSELQTDGDVQAKDLSHLSGRELQGVSSAWLDPESATNLESGSMENWNQFEANSRLFNVKHTYDENIYTKKLDYNKMTKQQLAKAERMAKEIEGGLRFSVGFRVRC
jgi:PAB1-binding protein PBP1